MATETGGDSTDVKHDVEAVGAAEPPQEDFAALFAASEAENKSKKKIEVGDVVSGRVIAVGQNAAFVAIGGKGEASIDLAEFRDSTSGEIKIAVGDTVEATVTDDGSKSGSVVLTRVFGRGGHQSSELEQAMAMRVPVEGIVTGENKGGFDIQIGTVRAFCPGSQIDRRRSGERVLGSTHIGQRYQFRVTKVDNGGRNVVVSRRELLEEEAQAQAAQLWETLKVGATVKGTVSSLLDFGAFVDLGGIEGLIHISELGYTRVKHPSEVLEVGQPVEVQVIKVDEPTPGDSRRRRQVGLSLKALALDPWTTAAQQFPVGAVVRGKVVRTEPFGAFVMIAPGLEGLVHVSKITLDKRLSHARQGVSVGDEVDVTVLSIEPAQRRLSLSMVESARQSRDAEEAGERAQTAAMMSKTNERKTLGTFSDLLGSGKK